MDAILGLLLVVAVIIVMLKPTREGVARALRLFIYGGIVWFAWWYFVYLGGWRFLP